MTEAAAAAGTPAAGTPAPAPAAPLWTEGFDADTLNFVTAKGWTGAGPAVSSYRNLEKLTGVPAEQMIRLPKEMNDTTMGPVYDRLGRPKTPAEYKLPIAGGDKGEFAGVVSKWFHDSGLGLGQATKIAGEWQKYIDAMTKSDGDKYTKAVEVDKNTLKTSWSSLHDTNLAIAKGAARAFNLSDEQINGLEQTLGYAGVHKLLFEIGSKIGEAEFHTGSGGSGPTGAKTPDQARAQIAINRQDPNFAARFNSKDPVQQGEARAEMDRLHKIAYPGETGHAVRVGR